MPEVTTMNQVGDTEDQNPTSHTEVAITVGLIDQVTHMMVEENTISTTNWVMGTCHGEGEEVDGHHHSRIIAGKTTVVFSPLI